MSKKTKRFYGYSENIEYFLIFLEHKWIEIEHVMEAATSNIMATSLRQALTHPAHSFPSTPNLISVFQKLHLWASGIA